MTSLMLEMNFSDFRKRDFGKNFEKMLYEPNFESDDALFEDYLQKNKWKAFKLNLTKSILCQNDYSRLLNDKQPGLVSDQSSRARLQKTLQSLETIRGTMAQCNSIVSRYIKEKEDSTPMILNVKNRLAVTRIALRKKASKRLQLESCLRI
jgi:hypothetical protein